MNETPRHRALQFLLRTLAVVFVVLVLAVAGLWWYSTTPQFENKVRSILVSTLEDSVGGRIELGAVHWKLLHLDFEIDNLTIHGNEAPTEVPFAHLDKLHVRLKIISLFRAAIGLNYLGVEHPVVHLIVYKDGSTNQPTPRKKSQPSNKSTTDTIFDLAVDRTELNNGVALVNQQAIPFNVAANGLKVLVNYVPAKDHYTGNLTIADLSVQKGVASPIHSELSVDLDSGRNEASVTQLTFKAGASTLAAHAHIANFNDPHWQADAKGTIDLREAEALAGVPGLDGGVVRLDLQGQGTKALFTVDGETRVAGVSYVTPAAKIRGLDASTKVHITQDELSLNDLRASLARGGAVDGEAHLYHWLAPTTPAASAPAAQPLQPGTKVAATAQAARQANRAIAQATSNPAAKAEVSRGVVRARLSGFTLPTLLSIVAPPKYQDLGFATTAGGTLEANWTGNASDLAADAKIALTAPAQPAHGDVPVNGLLDAHYEGRTSSLLVRQARVDTPGTHVQASGGVGLAAGRDSQLTVAASVTNLGEFNRALIAFGVGANGKQGTAAIPVALHGQALFNGTVSGNLAAPDVKGHLSVNNFDLALNQNGPGATAAHALAVAAQQPAVGGALDRSGPVNAQQAGMVGCSPSTVGTVNCINPAEKKVPVPVAPTAPGAAAPSAQPPAAAATPAAMPATQTGVGAAQGSGAGKQGAANSAPAAQPLPSSIHIDSLSADAEYSPALISIQSGVLVRGNTQVHLSGQVHAHQLSRHRLAFDNHSAVAGNVSVDKAAVSDLLALSGQAIPVTGTLSLHAQVTGALDNLGGGGHLAIVGGEIYGEPYKSLNADIVFQGQEADVSNLQFLVDNGSLTGAGGYNITRKQFHVNLQGSGFDLAKLEPLKKSPLTVGGQVSLTANASGTVDAPTVTASVKLANLTVANPAVSGVTTTGDVNLEAHTAGDRVLLTLNGHVNGASIGVDAASGIKAPYQAQARVNLANLDINPYLQLFNVQGVQGHSVISGLITASGPLANPRQLNGDAQLSKIEVVSQGLPISTDGGLHATLRDGRVTLDPVHVTGAGTDLHAGGSAVLFGSSRRLNAKANGSLDLKIVHQLVPDATAAGDVKLDMTVGGTLDAPEVGGRVTFENVNLAYVSLPNGLSNMNGSLVFDQGRLAVDHLTATSGGGQIEFGGYVAYQQGVYADLSATGKAVRVRYAGDLSVLIDTKIRAQGTLQNLLVSGGVVINRFTVGPNLDLSSFSSNGISPPPDPTAFTNHIRLDIRVTSAPQLDINNSYAKLAGDLNLSIRGTAADPSVLGHISITEGDATFAGTHYTLQHGDIYFTNPVRIEPTIDLQASAKIEDYSVVVGVNGTPEKLTPTFRSEPPLSEQDIFQLLAVGRTEEEQQIYSQQQTEAGNNTTEDAILGGALNATVSSRINKLFGGGSVKIDPSFISGTGNSTARITVQQQISKQGTVTYATNVNSTNEQLIQGQFNLTQNVSVLAVRDEAGVFSLILKLHQRYR